MISFSNFSLCDNELNINTTNTATNAVINIKNPRKIPKLNRILIMSVIINANTHINKIKPKTVTPFFCRFRFVIMLSNTLYILYHKLSVLRKAVRLNFLSADLKVEPKCLLTNLFIPSRIFPINFRICLLK